MLGRGSRSDTCLTFKIKKNYLEKVLSSLNEVHPEIGFYDCKISRLPRDRGEWYWHVTLAFYYFVKYGNIMETVSILAQDGFTDLEKIENKDVDDAKRDVNLASQILKDSGVH
ncbi:MAG: hypothetical protein AAB795_01530 [Patescibacteria group bacterium]